LLIANNKALASTLLADDKEYNSMSEDRRKATENIAGALMAQ
jgi:hypothetical protein